MTSPYSRRVDDLASWPGVFVAGEDCSRLVGIMEAVARQHLAEAAAEPDILARLNCEGRARIAQDFADLFRSALVQPE